MAISIIMGVAVAGCGLVGSWARRPTILAAHLRQLRDGYSNVEPEHLIDAMIRQQTRIVERETSNLHNPRIGPTRRDHARRAITWAESDRALIHQHQALLLSALR